MSMPDSARFVLVGEAHLAEAAAEERLEHLAEVGVDGFEGLAEALARFDVDFLDGLFGVADGIEQVLALGVQEVVALLRFLEFLQGLRRSPDPALRFWRAVPDSAASAFQQRFFVELRFLRA